MLMDDPRIRIAKSELMGAAYTIVPATNSNNLYSCV